MHLHLDTADTALGLGRTYNQSLLSPSFISDQLSNTHIIATSWKDLDLSMADPQHYSMAFGVNRRALLDTLRYFDVSGALIPDIMHDILEGVLPLELKLMLINKVYCKCVAFSVILHACMHYIACGILYARRCS